MNIGHRMGIRRGRVSLPITPISTQLKTSKTWFYNLPAAKATQFQGNRHLIVGAIYLGSEFQFFFKF